jgi:hypothetical protein
VSRDNRDTIVCKVSELQPMDKLIYGTSLGSISASDDLTVKAIERADKGRYALTLFRVGTVFVPGDLMVEIVDTEPPGEDDNDNDI